jgi:hypothetical protein
MSEMIHNKVLLETTTSSFQHWMQDFVNLLVLWTPKDLVDVHDSDDVDNMCAQYANRHLSDWRQKKQGCCVASKRLQRTHIGTIKASELYGSLSNMVKHYPVSHFEQILDHVLHSPALQDKLKTLVTNYTTQVALDVSADQAEATIARQNRSRHAPHAMSRDLNKSKHVELYNALLEIEGSLYRRYPTLPTVPFCNSESPMLPMCAMAC